ncbi:MAG: sugar ABC transporter permease [Chloroflexi bacterium]|nr:sugar ABC transporter permease [Chloroflexota bacterium]
MTVLREFWHKKHLYLFLIPTFTLLIIFSYYPPLFAIYNSFFQWNGFSARVFIGITNYVQLFQDARFVGSIGNLLILLGWSLAIGLSVPLIVAELIFNLKSSKASYFYRLMFILPMVVPGLVGTFLWRFILDPNVGLLNLILEAIGGPEWRQPWLGGTRTALISFMIMGFPWVGGTSVLIYLAGLQGISNEVIDAASIDGAVGMTRFLRIDLPLVMGQVKLMLILGVIGGLQAFTSQLVLTNGGPGYATMMPGLVMYQEAFQYNRIGYANAIGVITFLVILFFTFLNMKYVRSSAEYY